MTMTQMEPYRRNRLLLVALAVTVVGWLLVAAWDALAPFACALVLGYLLAPLVDRLSRVLPRAAAALLVLLLGLGLLVQTAFRGRPVPRQEAAGRAAAHAGPGSHESAKVPVSMVTRCSRDATGLLTRTGYSGKIKSNRLL